MSLEPLAHVPSAAWKQDLASSVVVPAKVLGSANAEILATQTLSIRGSRVCRPVKVRVKCLWFLPSHPGRYFAHTCARTEVSQQEQQEPTTTTAFATRDRKCPRCGYFKNLGRLSCCAREGAWFNKCGDAGDTNFKHTWFEGLQACKCKSLERASCSIFVVWLQPCPIYPRDSLMFAYIIRILICFRTSFCWSLCAAMVEVTSAVDSVNRADSSPNAMATVSNATKTVPMTTAGTLVLLLELNDI